MNDPVLITAPGGFRPKRGPAPRFFEDDFAQSQYDNAKPAKPKRQRKSNSDYKRTYRAKQKQHKIEHIAILDFETDPFDEKRPEEKIKPFLAVLHSSQFPDVIIWEEDENLFYEKIIAAIEAIPERFVIYAHNGGKFDFLFFVHKIRGAVSFKGRGLMLATVGNCELRDSFHIIPDRLANWKKDEFDYAKLHRTRRNKNREDIIKYCLKDCVYLLQIVTLFVKDFGFKLSIGQAAISQLRKGGYNVKRISEYRDEQLRPYLFGGRVECLAGKGLFAQGSGATYKLYDVNAMYPDRMANCEHPIGNQYFPRRGEPNSFTAFLNISCRNYGALVGRGENGETTSAIEYGNFYTTIHEYRTALELGLIEDIEIHWCIDCEEFSSFERFAAPLYEKRALEFKPWLKANKHLEGTDAYDYVKKDDMFYKFLQNNCWGKFTQNPRRYFESYITNPGERPDGVTEDDDGGWGPLPKIEASTHVIWQRPSKPWRFFNVGTGASITGAARAKLMRAINSAVDPIYCDTDSVICRDLPDVHISATDLGAWDIEAEFSEVIVAGKKLYACRDIRYADFGSRDALKVRSKGVQFFDTVAYENDKRRAAEQERVWGEMRALLDDDYIKTLTSRAPTLTKAGTQAYGSRRVRATAQRQPIPDFHKRISWQQNRA